MRGAADNNVASRLIIQNMVKCCDEQNVVLHACKHISASAKAAYIISDALRHYFYVYAVRNADAQQASPAHKYGQGQYRTIC